MRFWFNGGISRVIPTAEVGVKLERENGDPRGLWNLALLSFDEVWYSPIITRW